MSVAKRLRDRKRGKRASSAPFAWLPCSMLVSTEVCRLKPAHLKVLMLLHANYHGVRHEAVIPYATTTKAAGLGRSTIQAALSSLVVAGFIILKQAGIRPRAAGSGMTKGKAAIWRILHREPGTPPPSTLAPNQRRPQGKMVWHCVRLRADIRDLSGPALKVLVFLVGDGDRDTNAARLKVAPVPIPVARLAGLLGMSVPTTRRAVHELVQHKRLKIVTPGCGRRTTTYELARPYLRPPRDAAENLEAQSCGEPQTSVIGPVVSHKAVEVHHRTGKPRAKAD